MENKKFGKHLTVVLKEMCKRVKAPYKDIDFQKENWFREYEWTEEQEKDFSNWMTDYLYTNKEARNEISYSYIKTKKELKKVADFFIMMYGWKIKYDK
jgi:hypothetical protein